jgi:hypothetical protein
MTAVETLALAASAWLWWEIASFHISKPVKDGEPVRGPLSVYEYLTYNPGLAVDGGA